MLCPAGIGPQRAAVILAALPLRLLGRKGEILAIKKVMGIKDLADETIEYSMLISKNFRPYMGTIPIFKDEELHRLNMPVLLIAGDKDALFDSKTLFQSKGVQYSAGRNSAAYRCRSWSDRPKG